MSLDREALERLLRSDAALEQARVSQSSAMNTQRILQQPLSNFNGGSLSDPSGVASLERLQASIRMQQYLQSGTLEYSPQFVPKASSAAGGAATTAAAAGGAATTAAAAGGAVAPAVNAPAKVSIPVSGIGSLFRVYEAYQMAKQAGIALGNVSTGLSNIGSILTGNGQNLQAYQPFFADPIEDFKRRSNDSQRRLFGSEGFQFPLSPPANAPSPNPNSGTGSSTGLGEGLMCRIFGLSCPATSPEGVPNLGGSAPPPPFTGGQSPGVPYQVRIRTDTVDNGSNPNSTEATYTNVPGPIKGVTTAPITVDGTERTEVRIYYGIPETYIAVGSYLTSAFQSVQPSILDITRMDGQTDTGGDPAPLPGAANRPATTPALANRPIRPPATAPSLPSTAVPNPATTPVVAPPTAPPGTATPDPLAPLKNRDPMDALLPLLGALPFLIPSFGKSFNPSGSRQLGQNSPPAKTSTDTPNLTCRYDNSNIAGRVDATNATLQAVQLFMEQQLMGKINTIDQKLGPQIPNGGIGNFIKKTWDFLQVDRILSILTWIGVLHNAYMLSNGLTQTLFGAISNVLAVFDVKDADDNPLDVGQIVGKWTDEFFKSIFGVEAVDGFKEGWKKFNRIYQAAANILWSIQSMTYSMVEILEVISNYVGRIGNALRKAGGVLENAYTWMNPNANYTNNRFYNALNNTQEAIETIDQVASETLSIQETGAELFNQKQELEKTINDAQESINKEETAAKSESIKPNVPINPSDELRAGS
jgi:hypothetical protein